MERKQSSDHGWVVWRPLRIGEVLKLRVVERADLAYRPTSLYDMYMSRVYSGARDKILDATERVILRDGPHGVSVDAVLAESGMSKGGFFHHFPTKAALLGGLLERLSRAVAATAASSMRGDSRPRGRALRARRLDSDRLSSARRRESS